MHKVALEPPSFALKAANFFGVFGYISLLLEWMWVGCLLAYPFIKGGDFNWLLPASNPASAPVATPVPANNATLFVAVVISLICIGIAAYVLYTMPRTIGKAGAKLTHAAAETIVPAVTHRKHISKKTRLKLTFRTILLVKLTAITLPLLIVLAVPSFTALSKDIVLLSTFFVASWAACDFAIQLTITKVAKLNLDRVW